MAFERTVNYIGCMIQATGLKGEYMESGTCTVRKLKLVMQIARASVLACRAVPLGDVSGGGLMRTNNPR